MIGDDVMSTREANIALLSKIPDIEQQRIFIYLTENFCLDNPFKAKSAEEIYADLEESRNLYAQGEYEDFDDAIDEIGVKYGL